MAVSRKSNLDEHLIHEIAKLYLDSEYYGEVMCSTGHAIPEGNNVDEFLMFGLKDAKLRQQYLDTKIVEPGNEELYKLFLLDIILTARTIKWVRALADSFKKEEQVKSADKKEEQVKSAEIESATPAPIQEQKTKIETDKTPTTSFFCSHSDHQPTEKSTLSRDQISRIENVIKLLEELIKKSKEEDAGVVMSALGNQIQALQLLLKENKKGKSSFEIFMFIESLKKGVVAYRENEEDIPQEYATKFVFDIQHAAVIEILTNLSSELQSRADWLKSRKKSYDKLFDSFVNQAGIIHHSKWKKHQEEFTDQKKKYLEEPSFISCALSKTS